MRCTVLLMLDYQVRCWIAALGIRSICFAVSVAISPISPLLAFSFSLPSSNWIPAWLVSWGSTLRLAQ